MDEFTALLARERKAAERFVKFRISAKADAEDVLQETYLAAFQNFSGLKDKNAFKAWLLSIARNKCNDYFRQKASRQELFIADLSELPLASRYGSLEPETVHDTMRLLEERDRQILSLYYWEEMPQAEIAKHLHIPVGTVKSRLFTARQHFKCHYPYPAKTPKKGDFSMKKLPNFLPKYTIEQSASAPFPVKWEELMGWFLVPRLGEKLSWAMYDLPSRKIGETDFMEVVGKAEVHGIEGVEIKVRTLAPMDCNSEGGQQQVERTFVAQLTDSHCRYLAESHFRNGIKKYYTFLDGESFLNNWGFGEDNRGNEINLVPKGDISRNGSVITSANKPFLLDMVGRYTVTINGKCYDTVCVMDIETYNCGVASEQYLDQNGRTVLWRRFNRDDWAIDHDKTPWSKRFPNNSRLLINGITYVEWYNCITEYIL